MIDLAARCVEEFGEAEGAQIVALAEFLQQQSAHPAQPVAKLRVASEDIAKLNLHKRLAHKATSETVLASVSPDDPEFQSVRRCRWTCRHRPEDPGRGDARHPDDRDAQRRRRQSAAGA